MNLHQLKELEDVTDIVLNVKSLALKCASEGTKKLVLDAKGPGELKHQILQQFQM